MVNPLDPDDYMQRRVLRKGEATAKGEHALQLLLQLNEARDSAQVGRVALFIAATYNGETFPFHLSELRTLDRAIRGDMLLCIDALRWGQSDLHSLTRWRGRGRGPRDGGGDRSCHASIQSRGRGPRDGGVETAMWFADAIYGPQPGSNELISAAWAARSLVRAGADSDTAQSLHDLVMSTEQPTPHDASASLGSSPDAQLAKALSRLAQ